MTLENIEKRIEDFLLSDKRWPVIVDFSNKNDLQSFLYHFDVGINEMLSAGSFCGKDGTLKIEELQDRIEKNEGNLFLVHSTAHLKLYGEDVLKNTLKSIMSKSIKGHVVIVTYQCRNYLRYADSRFSERGQILIADGDFDRTPTICLIAPEIVGAFPGTQIGFEKVGESFESSNDEIVYIATGVDKQAFGFSLINMSRLGSGYEILCSKDSRIKNVPENFGEVVQWNNLLKLMSADDFALVVKEQLGTLTNIKDCFEQYPSYSDEKKWLLYIAVSVFGIKNSAYLTYAIANSNNYRDIPRVLFRSILTIDRKDPDFVKLYEERKNILKSYDSYLNESVDFCKVVSSKQEDAIYYLTDLTQPEKEKVVEWLDLYGDKYTASELKNILNIVYPDLATYLSDFEFDKELLNQYFEQYKYQKLVNTILPSFEVIVEEQAVNLDFLSLLPPRTQIFDKVDLTDSQVYFFDAMGAEYLGYIQTKCKEYGLSTKIRCGRCELPSLTCYNKDFVQVCKDKDCHISDIKDLDEIKHHGEENFDYEKIKTPVYIIRELEIIDNLLRKIQVAILNNKYDKAVIVSDHGASRLAVLHETENIWHMDTSGIHSGRCCPKNVIDTKPDFAIEEKGYWVLANYDRFKGGRKANVEVHGGATLEEVTAPIIEITRKTDIVEAFILEEYKEITLAAMEIPVLKIYAGTISDDIAVKINDKKYNMTATDEKYIYEVKLYDCTKKGTYDVEIINGSEVLSSGNTFEVKKKGFTEVSLFD